MDREELEKIRSQYARNLDSYFNTYADELDYKEFDQNFLNFVADHIDGNRVLDIGCGCTAQSARFLSKRFNVTGIDCVKENIDFAKSKFPEISFELKDFTNLDYDAEAFNGIVGYYCFGHIPSKDRLLCLSGLYKILRTNGLLALVVHEGTNDGVDPHGGTYFKSFQRGELDQELKNIGFQIIKTTIRQPVYSGEGSLNRIYLVGQK